MSLFNINLDQLSNDKLNNLKCYVLPGHIRQCKPEYNYLYNNAYCFWFQFMGKEMKSENLDNIESKLSSDSFMLFDDIFILVDEIVDKNNIIKQQDIVGFFCFDSKDVKSKAIIDQEYFKSYPDDIFNNYIKPVGNIMTIGHLLVHPQWRRSKIGIGLSDILVWFMHKRFLDSKTDIMIYWTRNNRSTNDLGKKFGGKAVLENYHYGGLQADVIVTEPGNVVLDTGDDEINNLSQYLWDNRVILKK